MLVQTGLDLLDFPTITFYQTGYSIFTLRQASRRSWRIGQEKPVRIHYLHYQGTMQERALELVGKKLSASLAIEGKLTTGGLASPCSGEDMTLMLARALVQGSRIEGAAMQLPEVYRIDLTSQCNLNCLHCQARHLRGIKELTPKEWVGIIDELAAFGAGYIIFLGGASLVRQDFFTILDHVKIKNIATSLTTNGSLLTQAMCDRLLNYYGSSVIVSLDGYDEASHDFIRGSGSFRKVIQVLDWCRKLRREKGTYEIGASVTVHRGNMEHVERLVDIANTYELDFLTFAEVHPCGQAKANWEVLGLSAQELAETGTRLARKILQDSHVPFVRTDFFSSIFRKYLKERRGIDYPQEPRVECASLYECYIQSNGKVYPSQQCSNLLPASLEGAKRFGLCFEDNSLLERSISEIWSSDEFRKYRRFVMRRDYIAECSPCNHCEFSRTYCIPSPRLSFEKQADNHDLCTYCHNALRVEPGSGLDHKRTL